MPQFFLNKRLILLLVSIIILVALIGFSLQDRDKLTWPEQFVKDSVGWVQSLFHKPSQSLAGFFNNIHDIQNTYEENKLLKEKLDQYVILETEAQILKKENEELKAVLEKTESLDDYDSIQATVINRDPTLWYDLLTVNRGSQHGVKANMAVITSQGLIGKVKSVSAYHSTIQLLSSPDRKNRISAYVQDVQNQFFVIEGYDQEEESLLLKEIPFEVEVKEGQSVLTSGLGGVFPKNLLIGEVTEVVADNYGLTKTAYVKPAADFYEINHVIIVDRKMDVVEEVEGEGEEE
ncbi:rod shape-determining protein MreC [Litchfieldia salsa]|uniref:Cell shape-determining protein MreC n=1 Tax=Litchfieldia salsa TaxID=930152 RepID=A0A1H0NT33_9BACI|nr:rod shape-determining protein MreC [Litchfieldia salsa]SDO95897.1 rod shape-determining protein MreC [Litchfieldia salsa]